MSKSVPPVFVKRSIAYLNEAVRPDQNGLPSQEDYFTVKRTYFQTGCGFIGPGNDVE